MNSNIEATIGELEEYIEGCKSQAFSSTNIIVNKEQMEEFITELRMRTPEEIKRYQKMISNKEAILADAKAKADAIIAQAEVTHTELVSEHQIMQQAYAQANEVVMLATKQAQEILDKATNDANNIRMSAISYTDGLLKNLEVILNQAVGNSKTRFEALLNDLNHSLQIVVANRAELMPEVSEEEPVPTPKKQQNAAAKAEARAVAEFEKELDQQINEAKK
ncbi:MAG: ATPase [Lachnospiraceae bacterium]|nr:ATPase [Lachnospiraceae bacterium]